MLNKATTLKGYTLHSLDGDIGGVKAFYFDDRHWAIRYLIIDTVNWWPGKKVLAAARWIERVSRDESKVFITLSRAAIKQSPEYTEESLLTRDYESRLHGHYNRQCYWVDEPVAHEPSKEKLTSRVGCDAASEVAPHDGSSTQAISPTDNKEKRDED